MIHQISDSECPAWVGIHFMVIVDVPNADLEAEKKNRKYYCKNDKWSERDFYLLFMVRKSLNNEISQGIGMYLNFNEWINLKLGSQMKKSPPLICK